MTTTRRADWSKRTAKKPPGAEVALEDVLELPVAPQTAWMRLDDVPLVASCIPGLDPATLVDKGEGVYQATMTNTVMGITANWDLEATIRPVAATRTLSVQLRGEDPKMKMTLDGQADVDVSSGSGGTSLLHYQAQLRVDGSLAAMGAPVIRTILADTITQFVTVVSGQEAPARRSVLGRLLDRLTQRWRRVLNAAKGRA